MAAVATFKELLARTPPGASRSQLDNQLDNKIDSDIHLEEIGKVLICWEGVRPYLGLSGAEEEAIKRDSLGAERERVGVLRKWRERFGPYATYRNLSKSFYDAGRLELVEAVCNLIGGPLVESQGQSSQLTQAGEISMGTRLGQPESLHNTDHSPSHNGSKDDANGDLYSEYKEEDLPAGCKGNEEMDKLYFEFLTIQIQRQFNVLYTLVIESLVSRRVSVERFLHFLEGIPAYKGCKKSLFDAEIKGLQSKKIEMVEVFRTVIAPNCSWFNHSLLENIIAVYCSDDVGIRRKYEEYCSELKSYCKNRVCQCSRKNGFWPGRHHSRSHVTVKMDQEWSKLSGEQLNEVKLNIADILKLWKHTLYLRSVEKGCVELVFQVPDYVAEEVFPLSKEQEEALKEVGVLWLNCRDYQFMSKEGLHKACESGNLGEVVFFLDKGADVNIRDESGRTPLSYACESGNLDIVKLLLDHHADVNKRDLCGGTPLSYACESGNLDIVKLLLDHHADVNKFGRTPLSYAFGMAPLSYAFGRTPLSYACKSGNLDIVKLLLDHHADVNKRDEGERTPLSYACESGNLDIVKLLLDHHADVNVQDRIGRTALTYARRWGHQAVVDILKDRGAVNPESKARSKKKTRRRQTRRRQTTPSSYSDADLPVRLTDLTAKPKVLSDSSVSSGDEHHSPPRYGSAAEHSAPSSPGSTGSLSGRYGNHCPSPASLKSGYTAEVTADWISIHFDNLLPPSHSRTVFPGPQLPISPSLHRYPHEVYRQHSHSDTEPHLQDHHREAYQQRSHSDTEQRPHPSGLTHPPIPQEYQAQGQGQAYEMGELDHGVDTAIHHVAEDVISAVDDESGHHIITQQHIPYDPNLTCPYCEKQFRMGEIQKYRYHVKSC